MSAAVSRGWRKGVRTVAQLIGGGALTALVGAFADLSPNWKAVILAAWTAVVAGVQNTLETAGTIPVLLPTPPQAPQAGG